MSFAAIRNTAYSSLMTTQVKMQITSSNIANADSVGYTRKIAKQVNLTSGGIGVGVSITDIVSGVNKFLVKDIAQAMTAYGAAAVADKYTFDLQTLFGSISSEIDGGGDTIAHKLTQLEDMLNKLAGTPESDTLKANVVSDLEAVAIQLRETSTNIQKMRANADGEIAVAVGTVNGALHGIDKLNKQITLAKAQGQSVADLEDMRNSAIQVLSEQMNVNYYVSDAGEMRITTMGGTPLLDSAVHELVYNAKAIVSPTTGFDAITVEGVPISGAITSGTIGGLIGLRDGTLSDAQASLDRLAVNLVAALNTVYNDSTSIPAPSVLTGSSQPVPASTFTASGDMRVVLLDSDGKASKVLDIDLTGITSTADLVDAINFANDPTGIAADIASLNGEGQLVLTAPSGLGIAVTSTDPASQIGGQGVSAYLGLNNLMVGTSAGTIRVRSDILATPSLLANSKLSTDPALAAGDVAYVRSASFVQDIANLFNHATSFDAAGALGGITTTFSDYAATILDNVAATAHDAGQVLLARETGKQALLNAMASKTGVNISEEEAKLSELKQAYSTAAQLFQVLNEMFEALLQAAKSA